MDILEWKKDAYLHLSREFIKQGQTLMTLKRVL